MTAQSKSELVDRLLFEKFCPFMVQERTGIE